MDHLQDTVHGYEQQIGAMAAQADAVHQSHIEEMHALRTEAGGALNVLREERNQLRADLAAAQGKEHKHDDSDDEKKKLKTVVKVVEEAKHEKHH